MFDIFGLFGWLSSIGTFLLGLFTFFGLFNQVN